MYYKICNAVKFINTVKLGYNEDEGTTAVASYNRYLDIIKCTILYNETKENKQLNY